MSLPMRNAILLYLSIYLIQLWYCLGSVLLQAWLLYLGFERYRLYTEMQWPTGAYPQLWLTVSGRGVKLEINAKNCKNANYAKNSKNAKYANMPNICKNAKICKNPKFYGQNLNKETPKRSLEVNAKNLLPQSDLHQPVGRLPAPVGTFPRLWPPEVGQLGQRQRSAGRPLPAGHPTGQGRTRRGQSPAIIL
jgi:hypothetical protein